MVPGRIPSGSASRSASRRRRACRGRRSAVLIGRSGGASTTSCPTPYKVQGMRARRSQTSGPFALQTETIGALPIVNHFLERLDEGGLLNDDRVGRALARLFDADRASLLNRLVLDAVERFDIDCSQLHNDSTSVRFSGVYTGATGRPRGGKPTPAISRGHSKDHRPDLKQLGWILTVTADGAVPIACRVAPGNTEDSTTHIETWDALVALLGRSDFLYVADCKLATRDNMDHIAKLGGRFVSVLPATRAEDGNFRRWLVDHQPDWTEALRRPPKRLGEPEEIWWTTAAPWPSAEGYPIVWVRSSSKIDRDATSRRERIARGIAALDELNQRLASPKTRIKTTVAVETAAATALDKSGATRWVSFAVEETTEERFRQERRGRPANNTRYRRLTRIHHRVRFSVREDVAAADAASDGCFPLITCARNLSGPETLTAYKYQPNLERRHAQLKGTQLVAPMLLHDPARIEGLLCCHFIAMLTQALIEREIRTAMASRGLHELSLYPEDRACPAPTAARVLEIFAALSRHHLLDADGHAVQTFPPELTELQQHVLELLGVPEHHYR